MFVKNIQNSTLYFFNGEPLPAHTVNKWLITVENKSGLLLALQERPRASNLYFIEKKLWHRCFPVNFTKFLRTPFLQNTSGQLLLALPILNDLASVAEKTLLDGTLLTGILTARKRNESPLSK